MLFRRCFYPSEVEMANGITIAGGIFLCLVLTAIGANASGVSDDGLRWASDDFVGAVQKIKIIESSYHQSGSNWVENESDHEVLLTFNRDYTFSKEEHSKPLVLGLNPERNLCFVRDEMNRIVRMFVCDDNRRPVDSFVELYVYDAKGQLIEEKREELGVIVHQDIYKYDSKGHKMAWHSYGKGGRLGSAVTFDYDTSKNLIRIEVQHSPGGVKNYETQMLDDLQRPIEIISKDQEGEVVAQTTFQYGAHGKWTKRISSGRGGDSQEIRMYEYDQRGNWIKRTSRLLDSGSEKRFVTRRIIEYFSE